MLPDRGAAGISVALALASALLVGGVSGYWAHRAGVDAVLREASTLARVMAARLESPVLTHRGEEAGAMLADAEFMNGLMAARVTGLDEQILARWRRDSASAQMASMRPDGTMLRISQPVLARHRPIGMLTLAVESASVRRALEHAVFPGVLSFVAVLLGALWLPARRRATGGEVAAPAEPGPDGSQQPIASLREQLARQDGELVRLRQSLDALGEAKTRFLANMSHEIRTPLNGVLGMTELLLNTAVDERQRRFTHSVRRSAESLLNIVNDILDFSRMESGKLALETLDFDMVALVEDVVHLHAESAQRKGLELACQIEPGLPCAVRGDPGRLRQVLTNLLGNAIKFTADGEVVVHVTSVPGASGKLGYLLQVADTGIGMDADLQERIFGSFFQVDASTTRRYDGSGLGLAISRHLVELMGGQLGVESEPACGARFTVAVTLECSSASREKERAGPSDIGGLRVLVVDDNETNRTILSEQLASWQVAGVTCPDAPAALAALRTAADQRHPFDIAILDMQMPDTDGVALARAIKADPAIGGVQLVLLTSAALEIDAAELRSAGIEQSMSKPARRSQLHDCLASLAAGKPVVRVLADASLADEPVTPLRARALLVEDNTVNQEVARTMLENLGCMVQVADDGALALEICASASFDVIFMDCQMPVMDGFEATAALKDGTGLTLAAPNTPIIALTANALEGDRERCLAAGMDDYISKPFKQGELRTVLEQWLGRDCDAGPAPADTRRSPTVVDDPPSVLIDEGALEALRQLQRPGRPDVLGKVVRLFTERSPSLIEAMHVALEENECAALQAAAHTLKSSSANLGASDLVTICKRLEANARNASFDGVPDLLVRLDDVFASTIIELERLCPAPGPVAQASG